jgi:hypothetical protein
VKHFLLLVNSTGEKNFAAGLETRLMEFFCVLSVNGSLASYHVRKERERAYKAVLRTSNGQRDDIPAAILLSKENGDWQAQPWHNEIVQSLIHAIEANGQ